MNTDDRPAVEVDQAYDGFISYSHAADDLLAPRLQSALQRFAKPWWKRRAVRIFRDESSLSANPHLWSSITEALDTSGWFVLLLSPDAAASEWVNQEIAYWVENRDPKQILPVVTDGEFGWDNSDVTGNAAPNALRGVFSEEPRWVDLRGVDTETELDLQNPEFAAAVADIASSIRGIPKDELASEEVRQHRRTVRTAWAAGALVTVLAVAAAFFAFDSAANARLARSRELSATAQSVLDADPELATLLSLQAFADIDEADVAWAAMDVLRAGIMTDTVLRRFQSSQPGESGASVRISADGESIVVADSSVRLIDLETAETRWTFGGPETDGLFLTADISPDGSMVVVAAHAHGHAEGQAAAHADEEEHASDGAEDHNADVDSGVADAEHHADDPGGRSVSALFILDAEDGTLLDRLDGGPCEDFRLNIHHPAFSPDGRLLAVSTGSGACLTDPAEGWVELLDVGTWHTAHRIDLGHADQIQFARDADLAVASGIDGSARIIETASFAVVEEFSGELAGISHDGSMIAVAQFRATSGTIDVFDLETGGLVAQLAGWDGALGRSLYFSADGSHVIAETFTGQIPVWSVETAELVAASRGDISAGIAVHPSEPRYLSSQSEIVEFALPSHSLGEVMADVELGGDAATNFAQREWFTTSDDVGVIAGTAGDASLLIAFDLTSGSPLDVVEAVWAVSADDGRFLTLTGDAGGTPMPTIWEPQNETLTLVEGCAQAVPTCATEFLPLGLAAGSREVGVATAGEKFLSWGDAGPGEAGLPAETNRVLALTADWVLVGRSNVREVYAVSRNSGDAIPLGISSLNPLTASVLPDGRLAVLSEFGDILLYEPGSWDDPQRISVSEGAVSMAIANDGRIAVANSGGVIQTVDSRSGVLGPRMTIADALAVAWVDDATLGVLTSDGTWSHQPLHLDDLVDMARTRISRSFTGTECDLYRIDPCPTLEEMLSR